MKTLRQAGARIHRHTRTTTLCCFVLLLAASCLPSIAAECKPLFSITGPTCTAERLELPCACSECMTWSPVPGRTWYEVQRQRDGATGFSTVGRAFLEHWCVGNDSALPRPGKLYRYRVRACTRKDQCGGWTGLLSYSGIAYP